jgi:hypothetical protein
VPPFAPRYPDRLYRLIETLDDERLSLAESARRIGDAAQAERMIRPSPVHVRRLCAELRRLRAEERELRQATRQAFTKTLPYRPPTPDEVGSARERVEDRIRAREHEKRS